MADGVEYHVRAMLVAMGSSKQMAGMKKFGSAFERVGASMTNAGRKMAGSTMQTLASVGKLAAGVGVLAGAYGFGSLVKSSIKFNEELETSQISIASTLQLMGFFKDADFTKGLSSADAITARWNKNLQLAHGQMDRVFDIAAKSPASFRQGAQMFRGMLPGAAAVTHSMTRINELFRRSLSIGVIMGGDFDTAGRQISRILEGGAGAEYVAWQTLKVPIREAGIEMGIFNKNMELGEKLTQTFNKLDPGQRLELVEKATESLGATTDTWATSWVGIMSTLESIWQLMERAFGKALFEGIRDRAVELAKQLDPEKQAGLFSKLERMMGTFGNMLAAPVMRGLNWLIDRLEYVGNNWETLSAKILRGFERAKQAAELIAKLTIAKSAVGYGMMGAGAGVSMLGGAASALPNLIKTISSLGWYAIPAALALAGLAAIVGSLIIAVGGVAAVFVDNFDRIIQGFMNGEIVITPFLTILNLLWNKFLAVGYAVLGTNDPLEGVTMLLGVAGEALLYFMGTVSKVLWIAGWASNIFDWMGRTVTLALLAIWRATLTMVKAFADLIRMIPGAGDWSQELVDHVNDVDDSMLKVYEGYSTDSVIHDWQKAWDGATADIAAVTDWESKIKSAKDKWDQSNQPVDVDLDAAAASMTNKPKGGDTHIHKMVVHQDLRNHDPDRIVGAFQKKVNKSIRQRVGASTNMKRGV